MTYIHNLIEAHVLTLQCSGFNSDHENMLYDLFDNFLKDYGFKSGEYCILKNNWGARSRLNAVLPYKPRLSEHELSNLCNQFSNDVKKFSENENNRCILPNFRYYVMYGISDIEVGDKEHNH